VTAAGPKRSRPRGVGRTPDDAEALTALQTLPAIGPRLAEKLLPLGGRSPAGLRGRDPETLYDELQAQVGPVDRCVLYAFRCAVYAAEHGDGPDALDPEMTRWWNWKDDGPALRQATSGRAQRASQAAAGKRRTSMASR
jgi:hypothetical protein